ncbi:hypothetical protein KCU65_g5693, partial [Aureobasidium melanogenum]
MQNNDNNQKQSGKEASKEEANAPAADPKPTDKRKSPGDLTVEELADYYANSKPPGRRYPVGMSEDMLNTFIDGVADPPVIKKTGNAGKKSKSGGSKK